MTSSCIPYTFIPDARPVWLDAYRVLAEGGMLVSGFDDPILHALADCERRIPLAELGSFVGIISGLIAIFSFITGVNSLAAIRRVRRSAQGASPGATRPAMRKLLLALSVFVVSIAITAAMGLAGSDTGGIMCLLLILCLLTVVSLHWLPACRRISLSTWGPITGIGFAAIGLLLGSISSGEEVFGLSAGILTGVGAWVVAGLTRRSDKRAAGSTLAPRAADDPTRSGSTAGWERVILEIAAAQGGRVRVTDIALKSELSLDQASEVLGDLVRRNYCRQESADSGAVTYRFPDLAAD